MQCRKMILAATRTKQCCRCNNDDSGDESACPVSEFVCKWWSAWWWLGRPLNRNQDRTTGDTARRLGRNRHSGYWLVFAHPHITNRATESARPVCIIYIICSHKGSGVRIYLCVMSVSVLYDYCVNRTIKRRPVTRQSPYNRASGSGSSGAVSDWKRTIISDELLLRRSLNLARSIELRTRYGMRPGQEVCMNFDQWCCDWVTASWSSERHCVN